MHYFLENRLFKIHSYPDDGGKMALKQKSWTIEKGRGNILKALRGKGRGDLIVLSVSDSTARSPVERLTSW